MASAGPYASLHLAADRCQHPTTLFFTGWMPFLPPNQQRQTTEGKLSKINQSNGVTGLQLTNVQWTSSHDVLDRRRCNPQALPSTSFTDHTTDLPWQELGTKFQREVPLFFEIAEFPYNTVQDRSNEASTPKTSTIYLVVWYNTDLWQRDRWAWQQHIPC